MTGRMYLMHRLHVLKMGVEYVRVRLQRQCDGPENGAVEGSSSPEVERSVRVSVRVSQRESDTVEAKKKIKGNILNEGREKVD